MKNQPKVPREALAQHRYLRDTFFAAMLYVGVVFIAALISRNLHPPQWALIVLALVTMAPVLLMLRIYVVYLATMDEFQRRLQTNALIFASGVTVFGSFTYGFLEDFAGLPHVSMLYVFPAYCMAFAISHTIIQWRNK